MRLAYFYVVLGIILSLVIVSSYAQVPLVAQSGQNTLSVGKISINYFTNNGYESTPAVPKNWQLSFLPLSWFYSPPPSSISYNLAFQNSSSGVNLNGGPLPNLGTYDSVYGSWGGALILYNDYVYAFVYNGTALYWTSTPIWNWNNIDTGSGIKWTSVGYSLTYLGAATLINNTVYLGAQSNGEPYVLAATLGSGGTISSWKSYQISSSGGGAVEDILYANGEWYIGVGESSSALVYYGSSLSGPFSTYAPGSSYQTNALSTSSNVYGDLLGLAQTQNGDIVVAWYVTPTEIGFAYYTPSTNTWSSVYTITAPSGYCDTETGIPIFSNGKYLSPPIFGEQIAATGNTVIIDVLWIKMYNNESYANGGTYVDYAPGSISLYYYTIGASSPTAYNLTVPSWSSYAGKYGLAWTTIISEGADVYLFAGVGPPAYPANIVIYVSKGTSESWARLANINLCGQTYYASSSSSNYLTSLALAPWFVFANSTTMAVSLGSLGSYPTNQLETVPLAGEIYFNYPPALSSYQISLSNIVPSGSFVEAYPGAPLNTMNLTVTVYQGLNMSSLTKGASQTWTDVASGSSLSWTTPWLQLQTPNLYTITITNSQSSATPAPFQQMIYIPASTASSLGIANNAQNVMFLSGGSPLYSWFEGNNGTGYIWWVKLPNGIPASSSIQILMNVTPGANDYATYYPYVGEAPQLSSPYGEYDNGQYVFLAYANGNTPISSFSVYSGYTLSQATGVAYGSTKINALKLTGYASKAGTLDFYLNTVSLPASESYIAEGNAQWYTSSTTGDTDIVALIQSPSSSPNAIAVGGVPGFGNHFFDQEYISSGSYNSNKNSQGTAGQGWVYGSLTYIAGSSTFSAYTSSTLYSPTYSGSTTNPISSSGSNLYLGVIGSQNSNYPANAYWNWLRVRAYPPNGVMPSISLPNGAYTNYYVVQFTVSALNAFTKQPMSYSANVTLTNTLYWDPYLDVFKDSNFYITGGSMTPVLVLPFQAIMLLVLLWAVIIYLIRRDIRMSELD